METLILLVSLLVAVLSCITYYFLKQKYSKYPPGPRGLPYFGSFFSTGPRPYLTFSNWAKVHGPVFSVRLGQVRAVILNDAQSIRQAFKDDAFSGRPSNKFFMEFSGGGKNGIGFADGKIWTEQRRFALRVLRDLGFGKKSMESIIMDEVEEFVGWLKTQTGQPISLNRKFTLSIVNSLWMIACGHRFKHDDPNLTQIADKVAGSVNKAVKSGFAIFLPQLTKMAPNLTGWNTFVNANREIQDVLKIEIHEHEKSFVQTNPPRDFVDAYLANIKSTVDSTSSFYGEEGRKQLESVLRDLFGAGSNPTSATLTWSVLYLAVNQRVQRKMQEEITGVVGRNRHPTLADRPNLPYTEAVIAESLRMSSVVPLGLFHNTMKDVRFRGFEIPQDTYVIANIYGVHHDPQVWDEPERFYPERFLDKDGNMMKTDNLLSFSTGRRICIGENLARDELFLFLTNIFQNFEVRPNPSSGEIKMEPVPGFVLQPEKFHVIVTSRL